MIHLKTILHPTDFSEDSRYALELACALAKNQEARVSLLHVVPLPAPIGRDSNVPAFKDAHTAEDLQTYRQEMIGRLEKLRDECFHADVQPLLREGDVASAIISAAKELRCDVIVMGSHGKSRKYQHMMGGVAAEVTRRAPCPVVAVRTPAAAAAPSPGGGMHAAGKPS